MLSELGVLALAWIAGLTVSWILAVRRSLRADLAAILGAILVYALPATRLAIVTVALVVLATRMQFETVDRAYGNAARSLGASEWRVAARLWPLAGPRILTGLLITLFLTLVAA